MTEEQQADFYRFMLDDVERLDTLINHMLDAARLDQQPVETDVVDVELSAVLAQLRRDGLPALPPAARDDAAERRRRPSCGPGRSTSKWCFAT